MNDSLEKIILAHKKLLYIESCLSLCSVAEKVDGFALLHMKTLRTDSKIFHRLGICFGDGVRLLRIIDTLSQNVKVKPKPRLTAQKDLLPKTKSVSQTKYICYYLFFLC